MICLLNRRIRLGVLQAPPNTTIFVLLLNHTSACKASLSTFHLPQFKRFNPLFRCVNSLHDRAKFAENLSKLLYLLSEVDKAGTLPVLHIIVGLRTVEVNAMIDKTQGIVPEWLKPLHIRRSCDKQYRLFN